VVSPPDVAAATAFTRRLPLPRRVATILEGESMLNDAAAIVAYRFAVAAAVTGMFSLSAALLRFFVIATGGVAVGLAVGWLISMVRQRLHAREIENTISLLTGYAAYLPAEHLGVSGILAVVATGLYLGRLGPRFVAADTRVQNDGMWAVVVFVLEGLIFILTGLELRSILESLTSSQWLLLAKSAGFVSVAVIVARFAWVYPAGYLRWIAAWVRTREPLPRWRSLALSSWAGLRGGESLVLAAAIPAVTDAGTPFPGRNAIIAITYAVILVTLIGQGFTLGPLLRLLGNQETGEDDRREEMAARLRVSQAALVRLEELAGVDWVHPETLARTRGRYDHVARRVRTAADAVADGPRERVSASDRRLLREIIGAQRLELIRTRDEGEISDAVMRRVQRELDLQELLLNDD
jgi:CPA1 family monovalent cation:H+ antiporter